MRGAVIMEEISPADVVIDACGKFSYSKFRVY
jgi:hypothetical protein